MCMQNSCTLGIIILFRNTLVSAVQVAAFGSSLLLLSAVFIGRKEGIERWPVGMRAQIRSARSRDDRELDTRFVCLINPLQL